jgi:hypothetical protein
VLRSPDLHFLQKTVDKLILESTAHDKIKVAIPARLPAKRNMDIDAPHLSLINEKMIIFVPSLNDPLC